MYHFDRNKTDAQVITENKIKLHSLHEQHAVLYGNLISEDDTEHKKVIEREFEHITQMIKVTEQIIVYYESRMLNNNSNVGLRESKSSNNLRA